MATERYTSQPTMHGQGEPLLLSVIIINWNTCDLLVDCLDSVAIELAHFPAGQVETLVIDNASSDESVAMVQTHFPWVQLRQNSTNLGFAAANNQGIQAAQGRYLYLLNADTKVLPKALTTLVNFMEAHPKAGAVGSRYLNPDGSLQPSCYPAPTLARELWRLFHLDRFYALGVYPIHGWSITLPRAVDIVQGASLLLRHRVVKQVGNFDTDYFMYTEEVDLCHRIRQAGWSIFFVPISSIIHYGGQSTRQAALSMFLQLYRSKVLYFRKHHGAPTATLYKRILLVATIIRLLLTPLAWLQKPAQRHYYLTLATYYRQLAQTLPDM